ncbi:MAG: RNA methyltransferase [Saprospiraceae bacterium]|nr:RNA methyltransferase [Saprospiraceae bacterium]
MWIKSLQHKAERMDSGVFVAEGRKLVSELLNEPGSFCSLLVLGNSIANEFSFDKSLAGRCEIIDDSEFKSMTSLKTANSVLGVFKMPVFYNNNGDDFKLYLENISDPGNMGTIIRTADWFGLKKIYCSPECVDAFNSKVVQASMASIMRVELEVIPWREFSLLHPKNSFYAATMAGLPYSHCNREEVRILCIGSEAHGLSDDILAYCSHKIGIPKAAQSTAESLNAAVATSILLSWRLGS